MSATAEYLSAHSTREIEEARASLEAARRAQLHFSLAIEAWAAVAEKMGIAVQLPAAPEKK